jgi:uncharacterized protein YjiS (DUF1127 family)
MQNAHGLTPVNRRDAAYFLHCSMGLHMDEMNMTTLSTNLGGQKTAQSRIQELLARLRIRAAGARSYDKTMRELSGMSNRDLADIGISRGQIEDICEEAARTAMDKASRAL